MAKLTAKTFKYTHYMTLEEWKQWKENFDNFKHRFDKYQSIKEFLEERRGSFKMIIDNAFTWRKTPQGFKYWDEIYSRTSPINQKKPCKK